MNNVEEGIMDSRIKVPVKSKIAYGLGDASSTLLRLVTMTYLTYFYTDVAGIAPAAVATLYLIARIFDAINDPFFGMLVDNTHTKYGKCRPWFIADAIPLGLFGAMCFLTPNMDGAWKLAFAYIGYIGYGVATTACNIPLGSILSNMTNDSHERTNVNTWRMTFGQIAGAISSVITVPLVAYLGKGDEGKGYFRTALLYGIFAAACLILCFFLIKETVQVKEEKKIGVKESIQGIKGNVPLYLLMGLTFANSVYMTVFNSGTMYYLKYKIGNVGLMSTLSLMSYAALISMVLLPTLNKRFSKRNLVCFGFALSVIGRIVVLVGGNVPSLYVGMFIAGLGSGFATGLLYAMIADCIDYGEYKSGIRTQGLTFSATTFMEKLAGSIGGAIVGFVLQAFGYDGSAAVQSASGMTSIYLIYLIIPMAICALTFVMMLFYNLDSKMPEIESYLKNQHVKAVEEKQKVDALNA